MSLTYLLWQAGASGPLTPGTAEQLNARSIPRVASLSELSAVDDTGYSAQAAVNAIMAIVEGKGHWKWVAGTSPAVGPGVIASLNNNRWVREPLMTLGGSQLLVDPDHRFSASSGTDKGLPFSTMHAAAGAIGAGDVVDIMPATYAPASGGGISLTLSSAWRGRGLGQRAGSSNDDLRVILSGTRGFFGISGPGEFLLENLHVNHTTSGLGTIAVSAAIAASGALYLALQRCSITGNGQAVRMRCFNAGSALNGDFTDCYFNGTTDSFSVDEAAAAGASVLNFRNCTFDTAAYFEASNLTINMYDCQVNAKIQAKGTLNLFGGQISAGAITCVTTPTGASLTVNAQGVDFKSSSGSGYMVPGSSGSITATFKGCTASGTAKSVGAGVTATFIPIVGQIQTVQLALNGATSLTTSDKAYFRIPSTFNGAKLIGVAVMAQTASSSGNPTFSVKKGATNMLSSNLVLSSGSTDSTTATIDAAQADVATGNQIEVACTVAGTGTKWVVVELQFRLP